MALEFAPPLVIGKADIDEAARHPRRVLIGKKRDAWACEGSADRWFAGRPYRQIRLTLAGNEG